MTARLLRSTAFVASRCVGAWFAYKALVVLASMYANVLTEGVALAQVERYMVYAIGATAFWALSKPLAPGVA